MPTPKPTPTCPGKMVWCRGGTLTKPEMVGRCVTDKSECYDTPSGVPAAASAVKGALSALGGTLGKFFGGKGEVKEGVAAKGDTLTEQQMDALFNHGAPVKESSIFTGGT